MTLLVRDEVDVVAATIEHHFDAGVDLIVATDNGSVDGTVEVLEAYRDLGMLELHHEPTQDYEQGRWVTRMARRAAEAHGADWVINCDADEFFWPDGAATVERGALASAFAEVEPQAGLLPVRPDNLVADPDATGPWLDRLILRDTTSLADLGHGDPAKVCHRGDPEVTVDQGNHGASGPNLGPKAQHRPLSLLHVPDRGYEQYCRKIINGGSSYNTNQRLSPYAGFHWRQDYAAFQAGRLAEIYAGRQRDRATVDADLATGLLVSDTRLRDRLTALMDTALIPQALDAVLRGDSIAAIAD
ncbi:MULTISPECIES: glycosyltransferase family 2 protein [Actinoalloteichus]|nr:MULTISPECIES: glycosyltransferase family 2 protein [Actinoalloteichus]